MLWYVDKHCYHLVIVCFRVFDLDNDGYLSKSELIGAIEASFTVLQQNEHSEVTNHSYV